MVSELRTDRAERPLGCDGGARYRAGVSTGKRGTKPRPSAPAEARFFRAKSRWYRANAPSRISRGFFIALAPKKRAKQENLLSNLGGRNNEQTQENFGRCALRADGLRFWRRLCEAEQ